MTNTAYLETNTPSEVISVAGPVQRCSVPVAVLCEHLLSHPQFTRPLFRLTQLGNAERFAAQWGSIVRYCASWRSGSVRNGRRWELDSEQLATRLACASVRIRADGGAERIFDDSTRTAIIKHAARSENTAAIEGMVDLASTFEGVAIEPTGFDVDPMVLNCPNGAPDLRTGRLHPHKKDDLITKLVPVEYDPGASCLTWANDSCKECLGTTRSLSNTCRELSAIH